MRVERIEVPQPKGVRDGRGEDEDGDFVTKRLAPRLVREDEGRDFADEQRGNEAEELNLHCLEHLCLAEHRAHRVVDVWMARDHRHLLRKALADFTAPAEDDGHDGHEGHREAKDELTREEVIHEEEYEQQHRADIHGRLLATGQFASRDTPSLGNLHKRRARAHLLCVPCCASWLLQKMPFLGAAS